MSNTKIKLIGAGVGALLKSKEIQDILNKEATVIKKDVVLAMNKIATLVRQEPML